MEEQNKENQQKSSPTRYEPDSVQTTSAYSNFLKKQMSPNYPDCIVSNFLSIRNDFTALSNFVPLLPKDLSTVLQHK